MKQIKKIFILCFIAAVSFSCERYEEFITDFDYTAVYFPHQDLTRSFVYGEFDAIKVAVQIGGRIENNSNEWAKYVIDETIEAEGLTLLPSSYYTITSADRFEIPSGSFGGELTLTVNQEFFNRADTTAYYIPFRITETSVDTILSEKSTMLLKFNVEASKFGHYYHNGVLEITKGDGSVEKIAYHQDEPVTNAVNNWTLSTAAYNILETSGVANKLSASDNYSFYLSVDENNSVNISANENSLWEVTANGISTYDPVKREFYLNYKFKNADGDDCTVADTLIFRNRILDGVNQWR